MEIPKSGLNLVNGPVSVRKCTHFTLQIASKSELEGPNWRLKGCRLVINSQVCGFNCEGERGGC